MNTDKRDLRALRWEFYRSIGVHPCLSVVNVDLLNSLLASITAWDNRTFVSGEIFVLIANSCFFQRE